MPAVIDREGRLFGRVNVLDLAILVLVLAFVLRLAYAYWVQKPTVAESQVPITFTVLVQAVRDPTVRAVHVGDRVYDTRSNQPMGEVVAVRSEPSPVIEEREDGSRVETVSNVYKDLYVTVRGPGRATPTSVMVGSVQIHIGTPIQIETRIWGVQGTVWSIEVGGTSP